jgi:predicted transcriptional regulator
MPRRKVDVRNQINRAFLDKEKYTWPELLAKTGVSKGSMSKYLREMIDWGIIDREVDTSVKPPSTVYRLGSAPASRAFDYISVPLQTKLKEFEERLQNLKTVDDKCRQKEFNRIFAFIVFNLLADHLTTFETALSVGKHAKSTQEAIDFYNYAWHFLFGKTAKATFELFLSDPEYERLFSHSLSEVIWIAEKIRPEGERPSDLNQALRNLISTLGV